MKQSNFASCETIKECNSSYTTDGEYIHYPGILNSSSVRLYCHNMNTNSPKTYLTLNATNVFDYPTGKCSTHYGCQVFYYKNDYQGKTTFTKVGIDTDKMSIIEDDYSFTVQHFGAQRPYGWVHCCSIYNTKTCLRGRSTIDVTNTGLKISNSKMSSIIYDYTFTIQHSGAKRPYGWVFCCSIQNANTCLRGRSTIDVTNTGLMISNSTTWTAAGWLPHFTVNRNNFVVQLRGDGGCGGARPTDDLIQFVKNPQYTIPTGTIDPLCNLLGL
ncbi:hypothetical protein LOTGIDRAFT_167453 [Lottia gigantea]|uniref:GON domain-containing protein n=1 Tax=Lottia gigantea TaxID=225164 RepID=V4BB52_LOTGI|nr:hypothetical protein LOTGIDRAFT_167453 [Lottia gigantea]ESO86219.1 hypothetical protein LOTGIDRAFT_167453 [Lottia gigantea]